MPYFVRGLQQPPPSLNYIKCFKRWWNEKDAQKQKFLWACWVNLPNKLFIKILVSACPSFSFHSLLKHFIHFHSLPSSISQTVNPSMPISSNTPTFILRLNHHQSHWRLFPGWNQPQLFCGTLRPTTDFSYLLRLTYILNISLIVKGKICLNMTIFVLGKINDNLETFIRFLPPPLPLPLPR